ncbi:hypothetical protein FB45DRAFT_228766 [Roridomyces roridus]|uniref:DUF6533 domain-containing protein n=1 Tax=Roridomyces roridus TaxID=1738132 RepID=A0AAD7FEW1_9AGAR|nr:hypothetical protein FB45DRAFT_228766 [Roridomyces roridus]
MAAAATTVLVFEHLLTFPQEVKYVWQSRRISIWAMLYVWVCFNHTHIATHRFQPQIRYIPLVLSIIDLNFIFMEIKSNTVCRGFLLSEMVTVTINSVIVDGILFLRVWILYNKSRMLAFLFTPIMIIQAAAMITIGALTIGPLKDYIHVGPILKGCYSFTVPRIFTFYAVPLLATSTTMFFMTLYKCGQHLFGVRFMRMPIVTLFLRDGVFLFLTILVYSAAELTIWSTLRPTLAEVVIMPAMALHSVVGARILLNIKSLVGTQCQGSLSTIPTTATRTAMTFHTPPIPRAEERVPWYLRTGELSDSSDPEEEELEKELYGAV